MRQVIAEFQQQGQMIDVLDGIEREAQALRTRGAWQQAVLTMQRQQQLWIQLFRSEHARAISEQEARHHAEAREHRIAALDSQVRLDRARLKTNRILIALVTSLALLAGCVAAFLLLERRRVRGERDRLSAAARHDPMTGAFSRYEFQRRHAVGAGQRSDAGALLLLDVDDFKAVNDQFGHEAGDSVLKALVERLRSGLTERDEIYRWGGEEFLLVLATRGWEELQRDVRELLALTSAAPVHWHQQAIPVGFSGGLIRNPPAEGWASTLVDGIRWADAALYHSKASGRAQVTVVELTPAGTSALAGRRPIDLAQLQDWQRQGDVVLETLRAHQHLA